MRTVSLMFLAMLLSPAALSTDFEKPKKGMNTLAALPDYRVEIGKQVKNPEYKDVYRSKMSIPGGGYAWCGKVKVQGNWVPFVVNRVTDGKVSALVVDSEEAKGIGKLAWSMACMAPID